MITLNVGCGGRKNDKATINGDVRIDFKKFNNVSAIMDTHQLGFKDNSFDRIICFETLEHLNSPYAVLLEFKRILKPSGTIIVSVPNVWYWRRILRVNPTRFLVDPPAEEYHKQGWDIHEFYSLTHSVGLEVLRSQFLNWYGQKRRMRWLDLFFRPIPQVAYEHTIYEIEHLEKVIV